MLLFVEMITSNGCEFDDEVVLITLPFLAISNKMR